MRLKDIKQEIDLKPMNDDVRKPILKCSKEPVHQVCEGPQAYIYNVKVESSLTETESLCGHSEILPNMPEANYGIADIRRVVCRPIASPSADMYEPSNPTDE